MHMHGISPACMPCFPRASCSFADINDVLLSFSERNLRRVAQTGHLTFFFLLSARHKDWPHDCLLSFAEWWQSGTGRLHDCCSFVFCIEALTGSMTLVLSSSAQWH